MTELAFDSAVSLARKLRAKQISSVELLNFYFDRVDKFNGELNAVIWQIRDEAMEDAKRADAAIAAGEELGPLHGVPDDHQGVLRRERYAVDLGVRRI